MLPPPGWTMTTCECDLRAGGAVQVAWKSDEADPAMTLRGVFTEVVPHERAVHTEVMALGSGQLIGSRRDARVFRTRQRHHPAHHTDLRLEGGPRRRDGVGHG